MRSWSLVLPAFNEADNIGESIARGRRVLDELGGGWEIVVVDDGSSDATWDILQAEALADDRIVPVRHPQNRGYGAALRTGFQTATGERIFFTDADLQFDLAELPRLVARADAYDIVAGYRSPRRDPVHRRLNAWAWGRLVGRLFDVPVRDVNCAFKLIDRRVFDHVHVHSGGAFVNTEILVRARAAGFSVTEVPVTHFPRVAGQQTGARPDVVVRAFRELAHLYSELRGLPHRRRPGAVDDAALAAR
ncbi:MAG: glycosyltransferase family 2 protein [Alphaproteobacteria bacterium]|nr:glycosyltransferase family 2 protein [Alphaproteobacteria bacterium]